MSVTDFRRSKALRMGPSINEFENTDQATTEAERDSYFSSNPANLAIYDSNSDLLIRLIYLVEDQLVTRYQSRLGGAWVDVSSVVTGPSGEVASLAGVPIGEIPYKTVTGEFAGSNMRVLEDGTLLAPSSFVVESGSVGFGEVLTLSEVSGFVGNTNHLNGRQYTLIDFWTPRDAASAEPSLFHLIEPEFEFVAQGTDTTNLPDNPLIFDYTVVNSARTNKLKFRTYAAMSNVRMKIMQQSNGVVAKYIPTQQVWQEEFGGLEWGIGDNEFDFGDTPLIFNSGTELIIELRADSVALKGNASGIPYFTATLQRGVFDDVITSRVYTPADIKSKLESLSSPNKLAKTAIQDAVLTVNGAFGDVVVSTASIGAQPLDATLTALAAQVTAADGLTYSTGVDTFAQTPLTSFGRTLIDDTSAAAARATLGLQSMATQDATNVSITGGSITGITDLAIADGGTGASDAATARSNLGLGTLAVQNANSVTITGGSITGITDLAIADGGTGASTASGARTNLGLVIGTDVQAFDNTLQQFSTFGSTADRLFYTTGVDSYGETAISAFGRSLIDDADAPAARTTLGLGTIATQNANSVTITGGSVTGITDLLIADGGTGASDAPTARTNLGLGTIATQAASNVAITGGSITGITDLAIADGGTGASTAAQARTNLGLQASTYTPTLTNVGGITSSSSGVFQYMAIDGVVTVSGRVTIDPTGAGGGANVDLGISLPIASNLASADQCCGTGVSPGVASQCGAIIGSAANDRAQYQFVSTTGSNQVHYITFTYLVV